MPHLRLANVSDARRAQKPWLPPDDRDVTAGRVNAGAECKPYCRRHGAMNRVHPFARIYRCSESRCGVGAEVIDA